MGAKVTLDHGYVDVECKRLKGATIVLDMPTVTGCENLMMAAALAKGRTVIENAAREPEVEELALVLNKMGARIQGAGTAIITIEGVDELHADRARDHAGSHRGGDVRGRRGDDPRRRAARGRAPRAPRRGDREAARDAA